MARHREQKNQGWTSRQQGMQVGVGDENNDDDDDNT